MSTSSHAEPLYASVDGIAYPLGRDECVFQVRGANQTHVMTSEVLSALDAARAFRTLPEHGAAIAARIPALAGKQDAIQRVLQHLVARGLMQTDRDYLRSESDAEPPVAPFAGAFIHAGDDASALSGLLDSLRQIADFEPGEHRWFVLDRARDSTAVRAHRDAAAGFAKASGARVEHIDGSRSARIAERLAKAAPGAAEAIERAWGQGSAVGASLNLALLLGAGRRCALLDDAQRLPLRTWPSSSNELALRDTVELETRFHEGTDAALAAGAVLRGNPFAEALAWSGRRLGALLAPGGVLALDRAALEGFEPSRHPGLSPASRVLATCNGERGDAADTSALFLLEGESRLAFCGERARYLALLEAAHVSRAPRLPTATSYGQSIPFLLDGSELLPPVWPGEGGSGSLFGVLAHGLHPDSVVLHATATVGRIPGERRPRARLFAPETPTFPQYLADFLDAQLERVRADRPEQRLRALAALLEDLADAPRALRVELLHEYVRFRRSQRIDHLQRAFAEFKGAPVYWQADVRELISVNGRALTELAPPRLAGWPDTLDEYACAERLARSVRSYADLLRHWPALWRAAAESGDGLLAD